MARKILVISYRDLKHPEQGGAEVIIHQIYRRLQAAGHEVTFLTGRFAGCADHDEIDGMEIIRVGNLYNFNFEVGRYFRRHLRDRGFDVIVEDLNKLPFYSPKFSSLPVLVNVPHLFGTTVFQQAAFPLAAYVYLQERTISHVYRHCQFQVLSDSTYDDLLGRGLKRDQLHVIRSGIDHDFYQPTDRSRGLPGPRLLYLGRLKKYKCIEHPIEVLPDLLSDFPDLVYDIAGEGDYRDDLVRIARERGVSEHVKLLGYRDGAEKQELLRQTRVLCYTSPKEGWGLSVIEANATGVPCVASNSPGLRESVRDAETGFLIPHGDLPALQERLGTLLGDDDVWRKQSAAAMSWANEFSWERMAEETLGLIELTIARHREKANV